ncbi:MAG TPA: [FeFe] hydrogenase H-cluster radical SAM maturase HydE, partial [Phycisphaerae bacterium]|nr:[FeFe] hydrogenase H-cluster radical SAM maturase HydE [Phycisphaerae bacterium]
MNRVQIINWLLENDAARLEKLWHDADSVRRTHVGDAVHLRGLIEFSNHCARQCYYCGLRADNRLIERYRMPADEILACARQAASFGYGTVVLQSGEDYGITSEWLADVVRHIKTETGLAVTLSVGERSAAELAAWREAGADRYLLRFETSNAELFRRIHPSRNGQLSDRIAILRTLRELDYEVGSGIMIGIPGQTYEDLARDLELFRELDLDMIGVGPFLPHPETPLGQSLDPLIPGSLDPSPSGQVPNSELMTYKVLALTRLMCPRANLPSTTALATLNRDSGRELGLMRGANIIMPNLTPPAYRCKYEIYPAKACLFETAEQCHGC